MSQLETIIKSKNNNSIKEFLKNFNGDFTEELIDNIYTPLEYLISQSMKENSLLDLEIFKLFLDKDYPVDFYNIKTKKDLITWVAEYSINLKKSDLLDELLKRINSLDYNNSILEFFTSNKFITDFDKSIFEKLLNKINPDDTNFKKFFSEKITSLIVFNNNDYYFGYKITQRFEELYFLSIFKFFINQNLNKNSKEFKDILLNISKKVLVTKDDKDLINQFFHDVFLLDINNDNLEFFKELFNNLFNNLSFLSSFYNLDDLKNIIKETFKAILFNSNSNKEGNFTLLKYLDDKLKEKLTRNLEVDFLNNINSKTVKNSPLKEALIEYDEFIKNCITNNENFNCNLSEDIKNFDKIGVNFNGVGQILIAGKSYIHYLSKANGKPFLQLEEDIYREYNEQEFLKYKNERIESLKYLINNNKINYNSKEYAFSIKENTESKEYVPSEEDLLLINFAISCGIFDFVKVFIENEDVLENINPNIKYGYNNNRNLIKDFILFLMDNKQVFEENKELLTNFFKSISEKYLLFSDDSIINNLVNFRNYDFLKIFLDGKDKETVKKIIKKERSTLALSNNNIDLYEKDDLEGYINNFDNEVQIMELLLNYFNNEDERKNIINTKDVYGRTLLSSTINSKLIDFLLKNGGDLKTKDKEKRTAYYRIFRSIAEIKEENLQEIIPEKTKDNFLLDILKVISKYEKNIDDEDFLEMIANKNYKESLKYIVDNSLDLENYKHKQELILSSMESNTINNKDSELFKYLFSSFEKYFKNKEQDNTIKNTLLKIICLKIHLNKVTSGFYRKDSKELQDNTNSNNLNISYILEDIISFLKSKNINIEKLILEEIPTNKISDQIKNLIDIEINGKNIFKIENFNIPEYSLIFSDFLSIKSLLNSMDRDSKEYKTLKEFYENQLIEKKLENAITSYKEIDYKKISEDIKNFEDFTGEIYYDVIDYSAYFKTKKTKSTLNSSILEPIFCYYNGIEFYNIYQNLVDVLKENESLKNYNTQDLINKSGNGLYLRSSILDSLNNNDSELLQKLLFNLKLRNKSFIDYLIESKFKTYDDFYDFLIDYIKNTQGNIKINSIIEEKTDGNSIKSRTYSIDFSKAVAFFKIKDIENIKKAIINYSYPMLTDVDLTNITLTLELF
jgi:hypothetical protein